MNRGDRRATALVPEVGPRYDPRMSRALPFLLLLMLCACPDADDDSAADDAGQEPQVCSADPSSPAWPPDGEWIEVEGWSTPGDGSADREIWVSGEGGPLVVYLLGRSGVTRESVEAEQLEPLGLRAWAEAAGHVAAVVLPGPAELGSLGWYVGSQDDLDYFGAALDRIEDALPVDRERIHLVGWGDGGRIAQYLGQAFSTRTATVVDFAGPGPWQGEPPPLPWPRPLPALFVHGPADEVVPLSAVQAAAAVFAEAGAPVHTWYDYPVGHEWDPSVGGPLQSRIAGFESLYCLHPE